MKVVQINAVYEYSSTGRNTSEFHQFLIDKGHNSFVFCCNINKPENNVFRVGCKADYKIHALLSRIFGRQALFSTIATQALINKLKVISPDVVLLGNLHANYINLPMLVNFLARNNIPTVLVLHDCWFFTGHCCHYVEDDCYKWLTKCGHCPSLGKYNTSILWDNSGRNYEMKKRLFHRIERLGVVGVSDWITNEATKSPVLQDAKIIKRIYNWIDLDVFKPNLSPDLRERYGFSKDDFIVLGVSQEWSKAKGFDQMIELSKRKKDIKVLIVGYTGKEQTVNDNLYLIRPTQSVYELVDYYSIADVLLNCSIQETFGKVAAEALACGTPIIANDATANPEIAVRGCGFVIHNNSMDDIIESIDKIKESGKAFYSENCLSKARNDFSKEINLNSYLSFFHELIKL